MRVLVVEDDRELAQGLVQTLGEAGMVAEICHDGREAERLGWEEDYDAVVLDLGLPGLDGLSLLRQWRDSERNFSVLVLTARQRWSDKLSAFQAGADDYLTKPFLHEEVTVRLRALQRRRHGHAQAVIQVGPLSYESANHRFLLNDRPLSLTAQEQRILGYLVQRRGRLVTRTEISEHVYARDLDPQSNTLDVLIGRIRRKLGVALIHTERGQGYRLEADSTDSQA